VYIWKLSPIDLQAEEWECSIYKNDVVIRAAYEHEARDVAKGRFGIATAKRKSSRTLHSPWSQPTIVKCIRMEADSNWEIDGPPAVLDPSNYAG
jgi:hypothetical protein